MLYVKLGWVAVLAVSYLAFVVWYGGDGDPMTPEEGRALLDEFEQVHVDPVPGEESFLPNMEEMILKDDGKEFYAVNLERLKSGEEATQADKAYTKIVFPLLFKRGGHPVFVGRPAGLMLGDYGDSLSRVGVIRYRSLKDMIQMASHPNMVEGGKLKFAALDHSEVFIVRPHVTFMQVRFTLGILMTLIGAAGWFGLSLINSKLIAG